MGKTQVKYLTFCALGILTKIFTRGYLTFSTKRALLNFFISLIFFLSHLHSSLTFSTQLLSLISSQSSPSLTTATPSPPPTTTKPKTKKQKTNQNLKNPFSTKKKKKIKETQLFRCLRWLWSVWWLGGNGSVRWVGGICATVEIWLPHWIEQGSVGLLPPLLENPPIEKHGN